MGGQWEITDEWSLGGQWGSMSAQWVVMRRSLSLNVLRHLVCESCAKDLLVRLMAVAHRDLTVGTRMYLAPDTNLVLSLR